jgi:hypothetical protein
MGKLILDLCAGSGAWSEPYRLGVLPTEGSKMHRLSSSQAAQRAITPPGFARAFFEANP